MTFLGIRHPQSTRLNLADLSDAPAHEITSPALSNQGAGMKPAVSHAKWLVATLAIRRSHCQRYARPFHPTTKSWSDRELRPDQAKLRRSRDFARRRWPFGQHKMAVCRVAPTAAPRIPRVNLPMAAPFGLGSRRGICVYHRRCGTISFRQTRALWSTFGRGSALATRCPSSLPLCFRHRQQIVGS